MRPCRLGDVSRVNRLLRASWHATYDPILGERMARERGRRVYSAASLAMWIAQSRWSYRSTRMPVATRGDMLVGVAMAQLDASEIVLWMLYVHPEWKRRGIGSALLQAVTGSYTRAKAIRVEVLKDNVAAVAWYKARGFEVYGEAGSATGMPGVAVLYMDKRLDLLTQQC